MTDQRTLIGVVIAIAGLIWFLFPQIGDLFKLPRPSPKPLPQPGVELDRVAVFATLDEMRSWFERQGNAAGVKAMLDGCEALIERGGDDA